MFDKTLDYKFLTQDELIISLDRLSRFKLPELAYKKVIFSIVSKNLKVPKYSKTQLEQMNVEEIVYIFETIWNSSVQNIYGKKYKFKKNYSLKLLSDITFKEIDSDTEKLIDLKIIIEPILNSIDYGEAPLNLKYLIKTFNLTKKNDILNTSKKYSLKFPIRKLVIVEGITEEILLPVFAKKLNFDFDKEGIFILGAGGKSKSPSLYLELKNKLNIPVILLFDNDAKEIAQNLKEKILPKDKILLIEKGEFEDILSLNLLKRCLNKEYEPITKLTLNELKYNERMTKNIEEFYKSRHLGEFKKSKLSKLISQNIKYPSDISDEIRSLISKIFI